MKIKVFVHGCDDTTSVELNITPAELVTFYYLAEAINKASTGHCQPTMEIEDV